MAQRSTDEKRFSIGKMALDNINCGFFPQMYADLYADNASTPGRGFILQKDTIEPAKIIRAICREYFTGRRRIATDNTDEHR
jgi:hypothetical protein